MTHAVIPGAVLPPREIHVSTHGRAIQVWVRDATKFSAVCHVFATSSDKEEAVYLGEANTQDEVNKLASQANNVI